MRSLNRSFSVLGLIFLAGIMVLSGCASKKYVRTRVGELQPAIQEAQNGVKENGERIDAVDKRAQTGIATAQSAAQAADQKATQAGTAAQTANTAAAAADKKADTANQAVQQANTRINTVDTRINGLDTFTVGDTQSVVFKLNSTTLSDQGKATLDKIAGDVSGMRNGGYMIELQGFTDSTGSENYNINLSQRRAEVVQRYLVSKDVPLFRIAIVGLGEAKPVADNKTRTGRDQNRRVEVRVLKSPLAGGRATNE